ncbi:MAG: acyltransferase family protein [Patescibacteria group bacterium]
MRYALLDLIRVLAVFMVVFFHLSTRFSSFFSKGIFIGRLYYLSLGCLAVTILIVLSGLVLTLEYQGKKINFREFIFKRLFRIYSAYLFIFFFALVLFIIESSNYQITVKEFIGTLTGFGAFFGLWQLGDPYSFFNFFATSWFIGLILSLYLLFPLLHQLIKKYRLKALLFFLVISIFSRALLVSTPLMEKIVLEWFPLARLFEFSLGIYLGFAVKPAVWEIINSRPKWNNFLRFASEISFPLFLVHYPLLFICFDLWRKIGLNVVLALLLYLAVSIWVSWFFAYISKIILRRFDYYKIK